MTKDASFKSFIRDLTKNKFIIDEDVTVGKLPLQIDLILSINDNANLSEIGLYPINKVFHKDKRENIVIGYKSGSDPLLFKI